MNTDKFAFIRVHPWLKIYERKNENRHQRPIRHHHGGRTWRTVLAGKVRF
jgi:hypothetical protein